MENAVAFFTRKPIPELFRAGGTGDWVADATRVGKCLYVICTHNAEGVNVTAVPGIEHGAAFLIGRELTVREADDGRIVVGFAFYAEINVPGSWSGNRNPVAYVDASEFLGGLDLATLNWKPFPYDQIAPPPPAPLTIAQAKAGLAAGLGLLPEQVEIVIRA